MQKLISVCGFVAIGMGCSGTYDSSALQSEQADSHPAYVKKLVMGSDYRVERELVIESICGENDMQWINDYDGTLGPTIGYARTHKTQVGALTSSDSPTGSKYCSGTLIGKDLFITASHCIDSGTPGEFVSFHYERLPGAEELREQLFFEIAEVVEDGSMDYAVLRLDGEPGLKLGWAHIETREPVAGDELTIIQHPYGDPKLIEGGTYLSNSGNYMRYGDLDTDPGSSGSGILNGDGLLYGVHTNGGCYSTGGSNSGIRLAAAAPRSQILDGLAARRLPFVGGDTITMQVGELYLAANADRTGIVMSSSAVDHEWEVVSLGDGSFQLKLATDLRADYLLKADDAGQLILDSGVGTDDLSVRWRPTTDVGDEVYWRVVGAEDVGQFWLAATESGPVLADLAQAWHHELR